MLDIKDSADPDLRDIFDFLRRTVTASAVIAVLELVVQSVTGYRAFRINKRVARGDDDGDASPTCVDRVCRPLGNLLIIAFLGNLRAGFLR